MSSGLPDLLMIMFALRNRGALLRPTAPALAVPPSATPTAVPAATTPHASHAPAAHMPA
jgi:hypothetical protein